MNSRSSLMNNHSFNYITKGVSQDLHKTGHYLIANSSTNEQTSISLCIITHPATLSHFHTINAK